MFTSRARLSTRQLQRLVVVAGLIVAASAVFFASYYYWDRYVHLGDASPADRDIAQLEQAIREDPDDPDRRVVLAEYYLNQALYAQALAQVEQVLAAYPDHPGALLVGGITQARNNQPAKAIPWLAQYVALQKDLPMAKTDMRLETAYYFLGESYLKVNRTAEAAAALDAALEINPTDADALYQS